MNALRGPVSSLLPRLMFDAGTIHLSGEPLPSVNANLHSKRSHVCRRTCICRRFERTIPSISGKRKPFALSLAERGIFEDL